MKPKEEIFLSLQMVAHLWNSNLICCIVGLILLTSLVIIPSKRDLRRLGSMAEAIYTLFDALNRPTTRSHECTGAAADVQSFAPKLQAITALGVSPTAQLRRNGAVATPTAAGAQSNTAKACAFILNVTQPNGEVKDVKMIIPNIKPALMSGTTVNIAHADIVAYFDQYKTAGKLRLADKSTLNSIVQGYQL